VLLPGPLVTDEDIIVEAAIGRAGLSFPADEVDIASRPPLVACSRVPEPAAILSLMNAWRRVVAVPYEQMIEQHLAVSQGPGRLPGTTKVRASQPGNSQARYILSPSRPSDANTFSSILN
jgi:hypothetical protein